MAKEKLERLFETLETAQAHPNPRQPEVMHQAGLNGIRFLMEDLEAEIAEYEQRRADATSGASAPVSSTLPS